VNTIAPALCRARPRKPAGFTLIELMVVMGIIGFLLILVPSNLDMAGARSRLESTASTMVSVLTAARETAIIDGHETRVQFEFPVSAKNRSDTGRFRYLVTSLQHAKSKALTNDDGTRSDETDRDDKVEDEWVELEWRSLAEGVQLSGFSVKPGEWIKSNPRGDPVEISFLADGTVRPACALHLLSVDLPTSAANVLTVRVNALTAVAETLEGEQDLPKDRDASDFK
jgi:prepilin-type N-terminal cleavage/methylation domain-containing protein